MNERRKFYALSLCLAVFGLYGCSDDPAGPSAQFCNPVCGPNQTCAGNVCIENSQMCGGIICQPDQTCIANTCVDSSKTCGNTVCNDDQVCINDTCIDSSKVCGETVCKDSQVCMNDTCIDTSMICGDTVCKDSQVCRDNACIDASKVCGDNVCTSEQICKDGQCVASDTPCGDTVCKSNEICQNEQCIDPTKICGDIVCKDDQVCKDNTCVDSSKVCGTEICKEGEICQNSSCIDSSTVCGNTICDLSKEHCVDNDHCEANDPCENGGCEAPAITAGNIEDPTTDENGKTTSVDITLSGKPTADVTFTCEIQPADKADEATVDCSNITITPDNWTDSQSVTITGQPDHIPDGDQTYTVVITSHSDDPNYDGLTYTTPEITNKDVDKPGISATNADNLMTDENGTTAQFELNLDTKPTAPVTITVTSSDETEGIITSVGEVSGNQITIQPEDWDKPIVVVVTGVDDTENDPGTTYEVTVTVSSEDPDYNNIEVPPVTITNGDNDAPGANFSTTNVTVDESPSTESVSFNLSTEPKADVTVTITVTRNDDEVTVSTTEITIPKDKWNEMNTVDITGVADQIVDGDQEFEITFSFTSDDPDYNFDKTVTGTNKDTDNAGFVLPTAGTTTVSEDGTSVSFDVQLSSKPTGNVTVTVTTSDPTEVAVTTTTVTFTPENWNIPQTVTVTGVDDTIVDGTQTATISLTVTDTTDPNYTGVTLDAWTVTNTDNDTAGLVIDKSSVTVNENGGTDSFNVSLSAQPSGPVTVTLGSSDSTALSVGPTTLTFTPENWNIPQTVTTTGVNNDIADQNGKRDASISISTNSSDEGFSGLSGTVTATVMDDEIPNIDLTVSAALLTPDASTATLNVSLTTQPASEVTVTLVTSSDVFGFSTTTLTFTPENWNVPQTVTVTTNGENASVAWTTATITGTASSTNAYNGKSDSVTIKYKYMDTVVATTSDTGKVTECQKTLTLLPGTYKLQVWGASGGDGYNNDQTRGSHGGLGGYAEGILELKTKSDVYMHHGTVGYAGVYGNIGATAIGGGCNGGGGGTQHASTSGAFGYGGGGASDIRIGADDLYNRIIVAGGGGGADNPTGEANGAGDDGSGGYGGGENGGYGRTDGKDKIEPGTQTSGAAFGQGAHPTRNYDLGGGGGGWYGGKAATADGNSGAGGGSGYVNTATSSKPDGYKLTSSDYYLTSTKLQAGNTSFTSPTGDTETGHKGNGYAIITLME